MSLFELKNKLFHRILQNIKSCYRISSHHDIQLNLDTYFTLANCLAIPEIPLTQTVSLNAVRPAVWF